ncbi:hypothetical protein Q9R29_10750 [Rothia sp. ARF10]|nr:hypothetical protein [Rothia sp. ARF10]
MQWGLPGDVPVAANFAGDSRRDLAVWRPSNGIWYVRGVGSYQWGVRGDLPAAADFSGDGRVDIAAFRPSNGTWYLRGGATIRWGQSGDVPVAADYTGDGRADIAVFRPSNGTWYVRGLGTIRWGQSGDVAVPANYLGDHRADVAVYRPSTGTWFVRGAAGGLVWGRQGDRPVPAAYAGGAIASLATWRPSTGGWFVRGGQTVTWGRSGDVPQAGDFLGNAKADRVVWRPSNGTWYLRYEVATTPPPPVPGSLCTDPYFTTSNSNGGITDNGYYVHNNLWNASKYPGTTGTTEVCSYRSWNHTAYASNASGSGEVKTYPNVHKDYHGRTISSFSRLTSTFAATPPGRGIYNVGYDLWLNGIPNDEVMIWTDNHRQVPAGSRFASNVSLSGYTWDVYATSGNGYIAFVPSGGARITSGTLDIKAMLTYLVARGRVSASATVDQICYGAEIVDTGGSRATWNFTNFSITDS